MRILITGAGGMLGKELAVLLPSANEVLPLGHSECDITVESQVERMFREWRPDLVVNCAACADVDGCELDSERAFAVNATGAGHVARAAERLASRLFHISTDYVFDGQKRTPYTETDPPHPINAYGQSKWEGEKQVLERNGRSTAHLVIRTSWLFGIHRPSFVEKVMAEAQSQTELQAVTDQIASPTWTFHLAQKIAELAGKPATGILHVVNGGECSRYEMAQAIVEILGRPVTIKPIAWPQLNRPAKRPAYSVLDCRRLVQLGLSPLPHWKQALEEHLRFRHRVTMMAQKI
ncbi:MAG: dTDP-4-dehydrorhamnose reductase [Acidobacteria bacterium RIFCSPLOWO2_02_FULL_59_13]|nr:MAG: dTDP-4-dehydrorhamnose reductase [Acidobacteria bacterium RIFCSPLOWO2_02_FULL_59_13]